VFTKDILWAVETPVTRIGLSDSVLKGAESPLGVLLPAHGDDAAAERFWERLRAEGPARGRPRLASSARPMPLLRAASFFRSPACSRARPKAAAELQATGWVAWVDRCLPGEGSLLAPPRLPAALIELARTAPLRPWLEALSAGLTERAAEAAQERSLSQLSQQ
jgi:hypothetical protein